MRPVLKSMFGQLLVSQLAILLMLTIVLPLLILVSLRDTADDYVGQRLRADTDVLMRTFDHSGQVNHKRALNDLGPLYLQPWGSRAYRIVDDGGRIIDQGGVFAALPPPRTRPSQALQHSGNLDVYGRQVRLPGRNATIIVAQDRTRPEVIVDDVVAGFLRRSLWIVPIILIASTLAGVLVVARVTKQLRRASVEADRIAPSRLDVRLDPDTLPTEARGLALATNAALDRVEAGYRRQSEFVSSVAHELRTPMALLTLRCDALPNSAKRDELRVAIDQASHVIAQLMDLAMIEGRPPEVEPMDIAAVVRDAVETAAPIVYRSGRSIEAFERGLALEPVTGNAGLLQIAITNLIDNAVRHTPVGTHIKVGAGDGCVTVQDNGPGIVATDGGVTKFRSIGQGRSDSAGLGLAIVQRIMAAMHGTMEVGLGGPGTPITLRLPVAPTQ